MSKWIFYREVFCLQCPLSEVPRPALTPSVTHVSGMHPLRLNLRRPLSGQDVWQTWKLSSGSQQARERGWIRGQIVWNIFWAASHALNWRMLRQTTVQPVVSIFAWPRCTTGTGSIAWKAIKWRVSGASSWWTGWQKHAKGWCWGS